MTDPEAAESANNIAPLAEVHSGGNGHHQHQHQHDLYASADASFEHDDASFDIINATTTMKKGKTDEDEAERGVGGKGEVHVDAHPSQQSKATTPNAASLHMATAADAEEGEGHHHNSGHHLLDADGEAVTAAATAGGDATATNVGINLTAVAAEGHQPHPAEGRDSAPSSSMSVGGRDRQRGRLSTSCAGDVGAAFTASNTPQEASMGVHVVPALVPHLSIEGTAHVTMAAGDEGALFDDDHVDDDVVEDAPSEVSNCDAPPSPFTPRPLAAPSHAHQHTSLGGGHAEEDSFRFEGGGDSFLLTPPPQSDARSAVPSNALSLEASGIGGHPHAAVTSLSFGEDVAEAEAAVSSGGAAEGEEGARGDSAVPPVCSSSLDISLSIGCIEGAAAAVAGMGIAHVGPATEEGAGAADAAVGPLVSAEGTRTMGSLDLLAVTPINIDAEEADACGGGMVDACSAVDIDEYLTLPDGNTANKADGVDHDDADDDIGAALDGDATGDRTNAKEEDGEERSSKDDRSPLPPRVPSSNSCTSASASASAGSPIERLPIPLHNSGFSHPNTGRDAASGVPSLGASHNSSSFGGPASAGGKASAAASGQGSSIRRLLVSSASAAGSPFSGSLTNVPQTARPGGGGSSSGAMGRSGLGASGSGMGSSGMSSIAARLAERRGSRTARGPPSSVGSGGYFGTLSASGSAAAAPSALRTSGGGPPSSLSPPSAQQQHTSLSSPPSHMMGSSAGTLPPHSPPPHGGVVPSPTPRGGVAKRKSVVGPPVSIVRPKASAATMRREAKAAAALAAKAPAAHSDAHASTHLDVDETVLMASGGYDAGRRGASPSPPPCDPARDGEEGGVLDWQEEEEGNLHYRSASCPQRYAARSSPGSRLPPLSPHASSANMSAAGRQWGGDSLNTSSAKTFGGGDGAAPVFCTRCGCRHVSGGKFCGQCGHRREAQ